MISKNLTYFQNMIKKPVVLFTASRYFGYAMQFVKGMLIAKVLGPEMLGVWGFLNLVNQYLQYSSCGVDYAITVDLSTRSKDKSVAAIPVALTFTVFVLGFLVLLSFVSRYVEIPIFTKYDFEKYALILGVVAGLKNIQMVFVHIYRVYRGLGRIAAVELLQIFIPLLAIVVFPAERLVYALLSAMTLSAVLAIIIFVVRAPFRIALDFDFQRMRSLVGIGIPLLIYNLTAHLVTDSGRIVLSAYYPVQAMGYYSFATSITNAIFLGLKAIVWVVFPTVLSKTHNGIDDSDVAKTVRRVNDLYKTAVFLVIFGVIAILPLLFTVLPEYKPVEGTLVILLLVQLMSSLSFGYNTMAIARGKHREVAKISIASAIVSALLSLLVAFLKLDFKWVAVAIFVGIFFYAILQIRLGENLLNGVTKITLKKWRELLPPGNVAVLMCLFVGSLTGYIIPGYVIGIVIFALTSRKDLWKLYHFSLNMGSRH